MIGIQTNIYEYVHICNLIDNMRRCNKKCSVYAVIFYEARQVANHDLCILTSAHYTFLSDIEAIYLFLILKASYRYFPSHVKHWQSSLLNKNDHIGVCLGKGIHCTLPLFCWIVACALYHIISSEIKGDIHLPKPNTSYIVVLAQVSLV